jgi:hypothetical protein
MIKQANIIIVDEISMLDVHVLDSVDKKLRNLMELEEPFGGKHILLGGDRMQIIPVGGAKKSIYASSKYMSQFYHVELVEQMRQSGDPEYTDWIRQVKMMIYVSHNFLFSSLVGVPNILCAYLLILWWKASRI